MPKFDLNKGGVVFKTGGVFAVITTVYTCTYMILAATILHQNCRYNNVTSVQLLVVSGEAPLMVNFCQTQIFYSSWNQVTKKSHQNDEKYVKPFSFHQIRIICNLKLLSVSQKLTGFYLVGIIRLWRLKLASLKIADKALINFETLLFFEGVKLLRQDRNVDELRPLLRMFFLPIISL